MKREQGKKEIKRKEKGNERRKGRRGCGKERGVRVREKNREEAAR